MNHSEFKTRTIKLYKECTKDYEPFSSFSLSAIYEDISRHSEELKLKSTEYIMSNLGVDFRHYWFENLMMNELLSRIDESEKLGLICKYDGYIIVENYKGLKWSLYGN